MAPNKFEEHIKKQLAEREIQPSADAWKKISEQLEVAEKPRNKGYLWYAVAAGFMGIILVSTFYPNSENQEVDRETPLVGPAEKQGKERVYNSTTDEQTDPVQLVEVEEEGSDPRGKKVAQTNKMVAAENIAETTEEQIRQTGLLEIPIDPSEEILNSKILEIVAQVNLLELENDALTDAEVDSLLRRAQHEILNEKLYLDNPKIDAMALLSDVEEELDQSFRDKIFESLKNGFVKVRTAVAERNR